jgi:DNA-binding NtrC family response regulator
LARIVIVEDESVVLMLAESVLQQAGHDIALAATVVEAQTIINDKTQNFDLLFTDVELANHKEGGLTIAKLVAQTRPGTPVLYTSGCFAANGMQSLFVQSSAFLSKPYTAQQLTQAVSDLLRKRSTENRKVQQS